MSTPAAVQEDGALELVDVGDPFVDLDLDDQVAVEFVTTARQLLTGRVRELRATRSDHSVVIEDATGTTYRIADHGDVFRGDEHIGDRADVQVVREIVADGGTVPCRECGADTHIEGLNPVGRPIRACPNDHTQVGPFGSKPELAADGGE
ncbi:hypothetical protein HSRCO_0766 [Halanaeroarchaeum sp. HSR-CO]|uniref:hypothetical protein n=1 Tax=Halanaeroarchaeum sp. HSR-CO TaxID=2866382 RepID=UPI00217F1855|nr:hypothetical protein [Halanaeroarchaeum sp. HSR-CO]UWG47060.1 hypothetical protein HSRCO_0766 [Halanaeroarchaeum sp. HSR-CO]